MLKFIMAVFALVAILNLPIPDNAPVQSAADVHDEPVSVAAVGWFDGGGATGIGPQ